MAVISEKNLTFGSTGKRARKMLYPIGIQDFEKIRKDGFVYVDKTDLFFKMAQKGGYYFLSRPRRFGKSLLVSTMEAYFSGKKELFDGLAIAELEKSWVQYPVLRFYLSGKQYKSISDLTEILFQHLVKLEGLYGVKPQFESPEARFKDVIDAALQQIEEKGYARRFADDRRQIFKIGVRFSTENRCIDSWKLAD